MSATEHLSNERLLNLNNVLRGCVVLGPPCLNKAQGVREKIGSDAILPISPEERCIPVVGPRDYITGQFRDEITYRR